MSLQTLDSMQIEVSEQFSISYYIMTNFLLYTSRQLLSRYYKKRHYSERREFPGQRSNEIHTEFLWEYIFGNAQLQIPNKIKMNIGEQTVKI
jgi:hypothetical protein